LGELLNGLDWALSKSGLLAFFRPAGAENKAHIIGKAALTQNHPGELSLGRESVSRKDFSSLLVWRRNIDEYASAWHCPKKGV
jgi:hypothetical protein